MTVALLILELILDSCFIDPIYNLFNLIYNSEIKRFEYEILFN